MADDAGQDYVNKLDLSRMKQDALLVSIAHHGIINEDDLLEAISSGKIRAALDIVKNQEQFKGLSPTQWYASRSSTAYNSFGYLKRSSDMATQTLLNLLETGEDQNKVIK